jgi:hypothetical protein
MNSIEIGRELLALSQTGLHFTKDEYDRKRYERLREIAAAMLSGLSDVGGETIMRWQEHEFGYATPKVDVRGFILHENKVLLIREDADNGRWTLPWGWADVNETPGASVLR